jgi:hypothetical protein
MYPNPQSSVIGMLGRQWQLLGVAALLGAAATFLAGRLVPPYMIAEQRHLWGPLEPFSFLRENMVFLTLAQLCFGLGALFCSGGLLRGRQWGRIGLVILSWGALLASVAFGGLCFMAALTFGGGVNRDAAVISEAFTTTSVAFYVTCLIMLTSRRVKSSIRRSPSPNKQPNYGLQPPSGAPSVRAAQHQTALRAAGG